VCSSGGGAVASWRRKSMNLRSTILLAIVTALVGAFVYFYEIRGASDRDSEEERKELLFADVSPDDIDWIELFTSDGQDARIEREGESWSLVSPLSYKADSVASDGLTRAVATLKFGRQFTNPETLETYGLNKSPSVRFGFKGQEYAFTVGDETPLGDSTYLSSEGGQKVFSAKTFEVSPFEKSLNELRDRSVLLFERDDITEISVRWGNSEATLLKSSDKEWNMEAPVQARGDRNAVESLLSQMQFLKALDFVDEPGVAEQDTFSQPETVITLKEREGGFHKLAIGLAIGDRRLVNVEGKTTLFSVRSDLVDDLPQDVMSLRFREVGRFSAVEAKAFELGFHNANGSLSLSVFGNRDEGNWVTDPKMAPGKASRFLSSLAGVVAIDIDAEKATDETLSTLGLLPPKVSITIQGDMSEGKRDILAHVDLGVVDADRGIAARIQGERTVYRLHYDLAEDIPISPEAFRNRFSDESEEEKSKDDSGEEL